ncbi:DUF4112 domain-containing protein [uncultured Sphingomonas sp.]|uniref:DUF4112 domain-containing protein n=1 Tax=uncultured Sphingomonas sp. TaxID=158754 RepID=UPI0025E94723|nr:DUF4112 domain-containing protein [uncultured Sphingomonas sp.]
MNEGFAQRLPIGTDAAAVRQRIEAMEHLLEGLVRIPGLRRKVGLDVLLDFVPGIGPTAAAAMGAYLAWEARNLGMPKRTIARMAGNIGIDWALGMIPFVGAVPDFFFRSNTRNLKLIRRYLDKHHPASRVIDIC